MQARMLPSTLPRSRSRPSIASQRLSPGYGGSGPLLSGGIGQGDGKLPAETPYLPYIYLTVLVVVIILYMIFRSLFSDSSQGLASFEPEFCYNVYGYTQDNANYQRAKCWAKEMFKQNPEARDYAKFSFMGPVTRRDFALGLPKYKKRVGDIAQHHTISPLVWEGCDEGEPHYIGDCDAFVSLLQTRHGVKKGACQY